MNEPTWGRQPDAAQGDVSGQDVNLKPGGARDVYGNNVTLTQGGVREIHATNVIIKQGGAQNVEATHVEVRQGGASRIQAEHISVIQGGVALARADTVEFGAGSSAIAALAGQAAIEQGGVQALLARGEVTLDQSAAGIVAAPRVTLNNSQPVFVWAQHIEGDVKAVFGPTASAVFGAAFGAAAAIVFLLARPKKRE